MGLVPIFHGFVEDGRDVLMHDQGESSQRRAWLRSLAGHRLEIVYRKERKPTTAKQRGWFYGIAVPFIARELTGDVGRKDLERLARAILVECFGATVDRATGREVPNISNLEEATVQQTSELIEWLPVWCLEEHKFILPAPQRAENG